MIRAVYPGSFDPVTNGHLDIIERSAKVFDHLTVAVLENQKKNTLFTMDERAAMLKKAVKKYPNVEIASYSGLLVDYADKIQAGVIVKGLRSVADFELEYQMALINKNLNNRVETMFMTSGIAYSFISSTVVKEVAGYGGNIRDMVPEEVYQIIIDRINSL